MFARLFAIGLSLLLTACGSGNDYDIRVGVISGPETELMQVAAQVAKSRYDLDIKVVEFEDYVLPNTALAEGSIDANMFQHEPYLQEAVQQHQFPLISIGRSFIYPMGIYSKSLKHIARLPNRAKIGIPNDPSNGARALLLLERAEILSLREGAGLRVTPKDIVGMQGAFEIIELDAAQLPRALDDLDIAVINTNFALAAGYHPKRDALFLENRESPYANIVVIREQDRGEEKYRQLLNAIQSSEVRGKANELFQGQAITAW